MISDEADGFQLLQGTRMPERMLRYDRRDRHQDVELERCRASSRKTHRSTSDRCNYGGRDMWCKQWEHRVRKLASGKLLFIIWSTYTMCPKRPRLITDSFAAKPPPTVVTAVRVDLAPDRLSYPLLALRLHRMLLSQDPSRWLDKRVCPRCMLA